MIALTTTRKIAKTVVETKNKTTQRTVVKVLKKIQKTVTQIVTKKINGHPLGCLFKILEKHGGEKQF